MRTSVNWVWVVVVAAALTGCAAQRASQSALTPDALPEYSFTYTTHVTVEPGPMCPAYPVRLGVVDRPCPVSHPYYREARTLVVGPAPASDFDVTLKQRCPALQGKATVKVMRVPTSAKYFIGAHCLSRQGTLILEPGDYCVYLFLMGQMVEVAQLNLSPDTDYFACLGEI